MNKLKQIEIQISIMIDTARGRWGGMGDQSKSKVKTVNKGEATNTIPCSCKTFSLLLCHYTYYTMYYVCTILF